MLNIVAGRLESPAVNQLLQGHLDDMYATSSPEARGQGVGRALLQFLLEQAKHCGIRQLYLETGSMDFFLPARTLYQSAGFEFCGPFADYPDDPNSMFMTKVLR